MKTRYNPFNPEAPNYGPSGSDPVQASAPKSKKKTSARPKRPKKDLTAQQQEALARALNERSLANYPIIIAAFAARGIPEHEILPRENIFTFNAWMAKGRTVKKGEHGVKIGTCIPCGEQVDPVTGETKVRTRPGTATVFHISQTIPLDQSGAVSEEAKPKNVIPSTIPMARPARRPLPQLPPMPGMSILGLKPSPSPKPVQTPAPPAAPVASPARTWLDRIKQRKAA
jgi:hypothetical protein